MKGSHLLALALALAGALALADPAGATLIARYDFSTNSANDQAGPYFSNPTTTGSGVTLSGGKATFDDTANAYITYGDGASTGGSSAEFKNYSNDGVNDAATQLTVWARVRANSVSGSNDRGSIASDNLGGSNRAFTFLHTQDGLGGLNGLQVTIYQVVGSERELAIYSDNGFLYNQTMDVAFVFDGTQATISNRLKLYINGAVPGDTAMPSLGDVTALSLGGSFVIGSLAADLAQSFGGDMYEVLVFDTALTGAQIAALPASLNVPEPAGLAVAALGIAALRAGRGRRRSTG